MAVQARPLRGDMENGRPSTAATGRQEKWPSVNGHCKTYIYIIVGELLAFWAYKRLAAPCLLVVFCIKYYG